MTPCVVPHYASGRVVCILVAKRAARFSARVAFALANSRWSQEKLRHLFEDAAFTVASDNFDSVPTGGTEHIFDFSSKKGSIGCGSAELPLCALETGMPQLANVVTWVTQRGVIYTDQIFVQSDINEAAPVPEPSSILLLLSAFAVLAISIGRSKGLHYSGVH